MIQEESFFGMKPSSLKISNIYTVLIHLFMWSESSDATQSKVSREMSHSAVGQETQYRGGSFNETELNI